jgi:4'-phosphopantetheinyl transferase
MTFGPRSLVWIPTLCECEHPLSAINWTNESQSSPGEGCATVLTADQVDVYLTSPELVTDDAILIEFESVLSEEEVSRWHRFAFPAHRHAFLVSHAFLRFVLSRHADVPPASWRFVANPYGRPEIAGPDVANGLRFNLSHTDGLIAVAVARERAVGVDVENVDREIPQKVADSMFTADELGALNRLPDELKRERFFVLWTLKEAYSKARGIGLSLPFREFSFDLSAAPPIEVALAASPQSDLGRWLFELYKPSPIHCLALACEASGQGKAQVRFLPLQPRLI